MNALAVIRKLHMSDLLLPVGAALVTAGIEALGQRERRQRDRLAALQASVSSHVDALLAAGAPVPDELRVDELHPFDAPGLATDYGITDPGNPKTSSNSYPDGSDSLSGRRWKLAGLALVAAAGVTLYTCRDRWRDRWAPYLASVGTGDELADAAAAEYAAAAFRGEVDPATGQRDAPASPWDQAEPVNAPLTDPEVKPELTEPTEDLPVEPAEEVAALRELVDGPDPLGDECGWPGCTWTPKETTRGAARVTALAVHRSRCPHRPPAMTAPGA